MWYNPIMIWLLKSPFHRMVSKGMLLITVTGRKSGRSISVPTNYLRQGNALWIISWRERTWWRNLRSRATVRVLLDGREVEGRGSVVEEKQAVAEELCNYYRNAPQLAKYVGIGLDAQQRPLPADCERAAEKMVVVKVAV